jgi:inhibitor of KinA
LPTTFEILPLGDHAITISFGKQINLAVNSKALSLFNALKSEPINGVTDVIPAYCTLTLVYDVLEIKRNCRARQTAGSWLEERVRQRLMSIPDEQQTLRRRVRIPVCYDKRLAPDLTYVADIKNMSTEEVIDLHTSTIYHVYMIGFLPGFAYMASVDKKIATPRKSTPRTKVPAGSVGIAGDQTGIYPFSSPGGWQLIGQTPLQLFDHSNDNPTLFQPGDEVQFFSISLPEFQQLKLS